MARRRLRPQDKVTERCEALQADVRLALEQVASGNVDDPAVIDGVWRGEALGTLLWALELAELPPYDRPFATGAVAAADLGAARLRSDDEVDAEREAARLWHWRARTSQLQASEAIELPEQFSTFDQLVAATAMRGHEQGLLPAPIRGDFQAFGKVYRHLERPERAEAHSIAVERHQALNWLCGLGETWDDVPLDT
jgi:hypothetical protein